MTRAFDTYRRLARGLLGCSSLWLGESNVLYVHGVGVLVPFVEEYHRFDLRRIQSIAVVRTHTGLVFNVIFGMIALGSGGLGGMALFNAVGAGEVEEVLSYVVGVPSAAVGLLALGLLAVNTWLGPTCQFQIQTTTRIQKIRAARRLRIGRRVLAELAPALARAQMAAADPHAAAAAPAAREPLAVEPTPG